MNGLLESHKRSVLTQPENFSSARRMGPPNALAPSAWKTSAPRATTRTPQRPHVRAFEKAARARAKRSQKNMILGFWKVVRVVGAQQQCPTTISTYIGGAHATARLAQSAERKALNLVVVGSSPTVGVYVSLSGLVKLLSSCFLGHRFCSASVIGPPDLLVARQSPSIVCPRGIAPVNTLVKFSTPELELKLGQALGKAAA